MLRLLLLRHAEASPHAAGGDIERPLTTNGRIDAACMGAYFRKSGLVPDLTLVSPARRAGETLETISRELSQELVHSTEPLLYNASAAALLALLSAVSARVKTLLIVGHNPGLAECANALASAGDCAGLARMRGHFPAPCLAVIDFQEDGWNEARAGRGSLDRFVTLGA